MAYLLSFIKVTIYFQMYAITFCMIPSILMKVWAIGDGGHPSPTKLENNSTKMKNNSRLNDKRFSSSIIWTRTRNQVGQYTWLTSLYIITTQLMWYFEARGAFIDYDSWHSHQFYHEETLSWFKQQLQWIDRLIWQIWWGLTTATFTQAEFFFW